MFVVFYLKHTTGLFLAMLGFYLLLCVFTCTLAGVTCLYVLAIILSLSSGLILSFSYRLNLTPTPREKRTRTRTQTDGESVSKKIRLDTPTSTQKKSSVSSTAAGFIQITDVDADGRYIQIKNMSDEVNAIIFTHTPRAFTYNMPLIQIRIWIRYIANLANLDFDLNLSPGVNKTIVNY